MSDSVTNRPSGAVMAPSNDLGAGDGHALTARNGPLEPSGRSFARRPSVVAVDIGATRIKAARMGLNGFAEARLDVPTLVEADAVEQVLAVCGEMVDATAVAVAVAVPGLVDGEQGVVRYAANLRWRDVPLGEMIAQRLDLPVFITHDVRAACLAETYVGVGRHVSDLFVVVLGAGVGAGVVAGGHLVVGATESAGEFGHTPVRPDGEVCACGQTGCLEVYASAGGIARRYAALGGNASFTAAEISVSEDVVAREVWADAVRALGHALTGVTVLLDPAFLVLGGGLSQAGRLLVDPVRDALAASLSWRRPPPLVVSSLGVSAGRIGAAITAWRLAGYEDIARHWDPSSLVDSASR